MIIGYARVSTDDQTTQNQIDALVKAGCDRKNIYQDVASGGVYDRPQLHVVLHRLRLLVFPTRTALQQLKRPSRRSPGYTERRVKASEG